MEEVDYGRGKEQDSEWVLQGKSKEQYGGGIRLCFTLPFLNGCNN